MSEAGKVGKASTASAAGKRLGWIGVGRMGLPMAERLLRADCEVAVYNRTRSKAEPLAELGARLVDSPAELADSDIVFTMVAGPPDLETVICGEQGVLSGEAAPAMIVDSSTISASVAATVRAEAAARGTAVLAAPVSGNPGVVRSGDLALAVSGPCASFEQAEPFLRMLGSSVTYVGEEDLARIVKICHNMMLGVVAQSMAEVAVLGEKLGIARGSLLEFLNQSVMGSPFTRYKAPAMVKLDYSPTFTPELLLKDLDLGLDVGRETGVPLPVTAATAEVVRRMLGGSYLESDFVALLDLEARAAGIELKPEERAADEPGSAIEAVT